MVSPRAVAQPAAKTLFPRKYYPALSTRHES
jgi:hypothetical protein